MEIRRLIEHLMGKYERRDLSVPDKIVGITVQVTDRGIPLDQPLYTEGIVIEGKAILM